MSVSGQGRGRDREVNGEQGQGRNREEDEEPGREQGRNRDRNEDERAGRNREENEGRGQDREEDDEDVGLDDDDKCWPCEQSSGCFECLSKSDNADGTITVEIDFSGCKNEANIGWACCTGSSGPDGVFQEGDCDVPDSGCFGTNNRARNPDGSKCENVSTMFFVVPSDALLGGHQHTRWSH